MADQEIAKHTKKMWSLMTTSEHGAWHKAREMVLEIVIIVFAVSLSIWFHSLGEHRHEQAQVQTFLLGLKRDIQADVVQVGEIVAYHHNADRRFAYLASLDPNAAPEREKFDAAYDQLAVNNFLIPRVGRYEGFKSSGKLPNIENAALLEKITTLYDYDIPKANVSSDKWRSLQARLLAYADERLGEEDSPTQRYRMITSPKGKRLSERMVTSRQLYERFGLISEDGKAIIRGIDQMYPDQAGNAH